jgi:hypothetical protein
MNPWKRLHNDFSALKEAEDGIVRERIAVTHGYAYVISRRRENWAR